MAAGVARRVDVTREPRRHFGARLVDDGVGALVRSPVFTLQVNVGRVCNQACSHCHVDAGPARREWMGESVARRLVALMDSAPSLRTLDLTGGAPELNPWFRWLVEAARARDLEVIDRNNLTVFHEAGQEDLAEFLARHRVRVVASLPCYTKDNVDKQRGGGVFAKSIAALRRLNAFGYAREGVGHTLDLVYNPGGAFLPGDQRQLEADYRKRLGEDFGIRFSGLLTITNMPIRRFADQLDREGRYEEYMDLLVGAYNSATLDGLMCRTLVSVSWDGKLFDCDFNQMLDLALPGEGSTDGPTIFDVESLQELTGRPIRTGDHCYGCTAGCGSSCGGALA